MNNNILLEDNEIQSAQALCGCITDSEKRTKALVNALGVKLAAKFFSDEEYDVDIESGLCNIPKVMEDIDVADIYLNGTYLDVRVSLSDDELYVPKLHFDNNVAPVMYMFIKVSEDLSDATLLGFILSEDVDKSKTFGDYYKVKEEQLVSFYDVKNSVISTEDTYDISEEELFLYQEDSLDNKKDFYAKLLTSKSARLGLQRVLNSLDSMKFISFTDEVIEEESEPQVEDNLEELLNFGNDNAEEDVTDSEIINDIDEMFSTVVTPNIEDAVTEISDDAAAEQVMPAETEEESFTYEADPSEAAQDDIANETEDESDSNGEYIEELFNQEDSVDSAEEEQENINVQPAKKKSSAKLMLIIGFIVVIAAAGYVYYSNYFNQEMPANNIQADAVTDESSNKMKAAEEAMPVETVEATNKTKNNEEGNAVSIPAIEQNLDASVLVSNLKIEFEVPASYTSSVAAQRYLIKLGKIIQLNLKTELLLLNKPPITNKITVEIKYNDSAKKFETVGIVTSSGEQSVDNVIKNTIDRALNMKLSTNIDSFGKLQGNPILIIRL